MITAVGRMILKGSLFAFVLAVAFAHAPLSKPARVTAAELQAQDIAGKWAGVAPNSRGEIDRYDRCVKDGGAFVGDVQSVRGGAIQYVGSYTIAGEKARFDGKFTTGGQYLLGQTFLWTLGLEGDNLEGPGTMTVRGSKPFTIVFKRAASGPCSQ